MIYFLTTRKAQFTVQKYLRSHGAELVDQIKPVTYDELARSHRYPTGTYLFADIEHLAPETAAIAAGVWQRLAETGRCRVLNHPLGTMRRYELLRTLHDVGRNRFNVYRLAELDCGEIAPADLRYPVFLRDESAAQGAMTPLLGNDAALTGAVTELRRRREHQRILVTEFCDTADARGIYRRYSAFKMGERVLAQQVYFSDHWRVKAWRPVDEPLLVEQRLYFDTNPHEADLQKIFALANVEFGRIDYAVLDGRIQVWQIDTNPMLAAAYGGGPARQPLHEEFRLAMAAAFRAIDVEPTGEPVLLPRSAWQWQHALRAMAAAHLRRGRAA